ncbi:MAG: DMT family transporter [Deltaproteobacteria bacterium]|nr:DMT family transporter [Deltaproteobacteria bacterium]
MKAGKNSYRPVLLIAIACMLWATDSIVRFPASLKLDYKVVVLVEHLIGLLLFGPFVVIRYGRNLFKLSAKDVVLIIILGVGGSALGGIFFTHSIQFIGPSTATFFQMLQPAFVVTAAFLFLKERHSGIFFECAIWVILNAIIIGFPNFEFGFSILNAEQLRKGVLLAFLAMTLWGAATVAGKSMLHRHLPLFVVFWRWLSAVVFLSIVILVDRTEIPWSSFSEPAVLAPLAFLGVVTGVIAMTIYYYGLRDLPASVATFVELLYALGGVLLPTLYFGSKLSAIQVFGAIALVVAIHLLSQLGTSVRINQKT